MRRVLIPLLAIPLAVGCGDAAKDDDDDDEAWGEEDPDAGGWGADGGGAGGQSTGGGTDAGGDGIWDAGEMINIELQFNNVGRKIDL